MKIIMFKEKYSNRYFVFDSEEELKKIFLKILKERRKVGYFNNDYLHRERAELLLKEGKDCRMLELKSFFLNRQQYEYEHYEIAEVEEIK